MPHPTWLLLPGLDGTSLLFEPLQRAMPSERRVQIVTYPPDEPLGYRSLVDRVRDELPGGPFLVVAESFSGPVALALAAERPEGLVGVVLVATFARLPGLVPASLARLALPPFLPRPPLPLVRALLLGRHPPAGLAAMLDEAISRVEPAVLAARLRAIVDLDAEADLRAVTAPLVYLRATRDALVGRRALAHLLRVRPDLDVLDVHAPHLLLQVAPGQAVRLVTRWVAERTEVDCE